MSKIVQLQYEIMPPLQVGLTLYSELCRNFWLFLIYELRPHVHSRSEFTTLALYLRINLYGIVFLINRLVDGSDDRFKGCFAKTIDTEENLSANTHERKIFLIDGEL